MSDLTKTLDWDVKEQEIFTSEDFHIENYKAIQRNDNDEVLSVMKKSYNPLTNEDFVKRVEQLQEVSGYALEGFQEFKDGKIVLAFLKSTDKDVYVGKHKMENYMVIGNSHDGSSSFFIGTSTIFIRCTNAFSQIAQMMKVRHTKNSELKMAEALQYFDFYINKREKMFETFNKFRTVETSEEIQEKMINYVLKIKNSTTLDELSTYKKNKIAELVASFNEETIDLGKNLWGFFNAVTHYTTHKLNTKNGSFGSVLGSAANVNDRAYKFCEQAAQGVILETE